MADCFFEFTSSKRGSVNRSATLRRAGCLLTLPPERTSQIGFRTPLECFNES